MKAYVLMLAVGACSSSRAFAQPVQPKEDYQQMALIEAKWGNGPDDYLAPDEQNPTLLLAVDNQESVYVLDDFNNRVRHYDAGGHLTGEVPIPSYAPATAEQKTKDPLAERSIWIQTMQFLDGTLYALQSDLSKKGGDIVLEMKNDRFIEVEDKKEREHILGELGAAHGKIEARIVRALGSDPKFRITRRESKSSKSVVLSNPTYEGSPISNAVVDENGNEWMFFTSGVLRKYSSAGKLLYELPPQGFGVIVSKQGNLYTLRPAPSNGNSGGFEIIRYSKK